MTARSDTIRIAMLASSALAALAISTGAHADTATADTASLPVAAAAAAADETTMGTIEGVVTDAAGRFINGAEVRLDSSSVVARTNTEGRFRLNRVTAGSHTITVTYIGLPDVVQQIEVQAGMATDVAVRMGAQSVEGEIVVSAARPIAESEAAALQLQRSSTSLVSVVAADSIGRFPDQNIAAALSRLPGIAVQRDQGQERFVSLRGARTSWTTISFDGINVISPAGRTTRFDTIPSSIASAVVVRKAVTADMAG